MLRHLLHVPDVVNGLLMRLRYQASRSAHRKGTDRATGRFGCMAARQRLYPPVLLGQTIQPVATLNVYVNRKTRTATSAVATAQTPREASCGQVSHRGALLIATSRSASSIGVSGRASAA